jgi:hypothetical protein
MAAAGRRSAARETGAAAAVAAETSERAAHVNVIALHRVSTMIYYTTTYVV